MLSASPASCIASDIIATLDVNAPPINSIIENEIFNKKAIKIFLADLP